MTASKAIGILGGAFNPITTAHTQAIWAVLESKAVDEVWITPYFRNYYRDNLIDYEDRLEMCRIATRAIPNVSIFDYEIRNKLSGKTYDLLIKLLNDKEYNQKFYMVIGQDNGDNFEKWYRYKDLLSMIPFIVIPRKSSFSEQSWYKKNHTYF